MTYPLSLTILLLCLALTLLYALLFTGRRAPNLPPGPPTLPIIGNLHQLPTKGAYLTFTAWSKTYGEIFSLKFGSHTAIVLTSRRLVKALIDKKSAIYSNRPHSYIAHNLITGGDHILMAHYGKNWQYARKTIHRHFMESMVASEHVPVVEAEGAQLLYDMLMRPEQHMLHPKRYSNSVAMSTIWGCRTPDVETEHMKRLYDMMVGLSKIIEPGNAPPVDVLGWLHYVPERWWGNWGSRAKAIGRDMNSLYGDLLDGIQKRRTEKGRRHTFMDRVLDEDERKKLELNRHQLSFLGGTMSEGASDTSGSAILAGLQAFVKWPEVQRRAWECIDRAVGEERSPVWTDYTELGYVAQIVKETLRWRPVTPMAFPHATDEDDWIDGMFIPKSSPVFINVWGLQHDSTYFKDPDRFDPDHYKGVTALAPELAAAPDPEMRDHYSYGSRRRICPGMHLAERLMFVAFAKLLWAFEFLPGEDESGEEVEIDTDPRTGYTEGSLVCPKDYSMRVRVRSENRRETIVREFEEAKKHVFVKFED